MEWLRALYGSMMRRKRTPSRFSVTLSVRVAHIDPSVRRAHLIYIYSTHTRPLSVSLAHPRLRYPHSAHTLHIQLSTRLSNTPSAPARSPSLSLSLFPPLTSPFDTHGLLRSPLCVRRLATGVPWVTADWDGIASTISLSDCT
jgi:hypothetical protein